MAGARIGQLSRKSCRKNYNIFYYVFFEVLPFLYFSNYIYIEQLA